MSKGSPLPSVGPKANRIALLVSGSKSTLPSILISVDLKLISEAMSYRSPLSLSPLPFEGSEITPRSDPSVGLRRRMT